MLPGVRVLANLILTPSPVTVEELVRRRSPRFIDNHVHYEGLAILGQSVWDGGLLVWIAI